MTDKERLEELKEKYNYERLGVFIDLKPVDQQDLKWLFEQAERVQELEEEVEKWRSGRFISTSTKRKIDKLEEQNKRYREAIKDCVERMNEGGAGTRSFVYEKLIEVLEGNNDA